MACLPTRVMSCIKHDFDGLFALQTMLLSIGTILANAVMTIFFR